MTGRICISVLMGLGTFGFITAQDEAGPAADPALVKLARQADAIRPLVEAQAVNELLDQVASLPAIETRVIWFRRDPRSALHEGEYRQLPEPERAGYERMEFDTARYYETFYGTPLASMRAFDIAASAATWDTFAGRRVLDIGYGSIGQLRLLGQVGAHIVGLEVEPLLHALYSSPGDLIIKANAEEVTGSIRLVLGLWPRDVAEDVGGEFDLIITKNTLKRGYVAPDEPDPRHRGVDLSVSPEKYVGALAAALNPGGLVMIYNIGPAPGPDGRGVDADGNPFYLHMADIRCPFPREVWEQAGFEILAYDELDSPVIHEYAHAFNWDDSEAVVLARDFFACYTLARKRQHSGD